MKNEYILWAVKIGEADFMEQVITTNYDRRNDAIEWAKNNGFDRFREVEIDLTVKPNFINTIN